MFLFRFCCELKEEKEEVQKFSNDLATQNILQRFILYIRFVDDGPPFLSPFVPPKLTCVGALIPENVRELSRRRATCLLART